MTARQQFYSNLQKEYAETETAAILKNNPDCGYYELCQSFLDIALNSPKIKTADGSLAGVFQYSDIAVAKERTIAFIKEHNITDKESFFCILEHQYPHSAAPDDKRQKSGLLREDNCSYNGYVGTWYYFARISDDVYNKIVSEIKDEL